jgi:hypothetical protein
MEPTDLNPAWQHDDNNAWDRVKAALRRDWDQTRYDFGATFGQNLHQNIGNTVAQASGNESIPARHTANLEQGWSDEAAVRYGYSAAQSPNYRDQHEWNSAVEAQLQQGWEAMNADRPWADARVAVRYGWTRSPNNATPPPMTLPVVDRDEPITLTRGR